MHHPAGLLLLPAASLGLLISVHMAGLGHGWWSPSGRWLPKPCRLEDADCRRVVGSRWARVFGVPNAWLGAAWFSLNLATLWSDGPTMCPWMVGLAAAAVLFSIVLAASLVWSLRVPCVLCFTSHGLSAVVLAAWLWVCL